MAQQNSFSLEDLLPGGKNYERMSPQNANISWWGNTPVKKDKDTCFFLNKEGKWKVLFTITDLIQSFSNNSYNKSYIPALTTVIFPKANKPVACFYSSKCIFHYNWKKKILEDYTEFASDVSWQDYCPTTGELAYNESKNLFIIKKEKNGKYGKPLQISRDGSREIVYGQSVHRDEFGISNGDFWSPDGSLLCYYRMDQSMISDYPLVDISTRIASLQLLKYPMAGMTSHKVSMGVFNPETKKNIWLQTGDNTDQYYCGISWSPDSKKIFLYNLNRDQNQLRLLQFDAITGIKEKVLFEESDPKYVHPEHGITFLPWDKDKFIYWSQKDGHDHLYLFSLKENRTLRKITNDKLGEILCVLGFNPASKSIILNSTALSPIQHNLFCVSIEKDKIVALGNSTGVHSGLLNTDGSQIIDSWSAHNVPHKIDLIKTDKKEITNLLSAQNPWKKYNKPEISCGSIKAADNKTNLYYRLIKPINFDPQKKYPAIVYVYGGPHVRLVEDCWNYNYRGWEIYMAQKGYVIFVLDNRGSSERGRKFEDVTYKHLGREEMKDQIRGTEFLKSLSYVDSTRLGIHGWSFGGFMTIDLMLTYPTTFKVAVAGGPVTDWKYYEVMYGERFMSTPQKNPKGYKENNLALRAGNLKGRLLIINGYNDPVCVPQHTLSFIRACETAGTHPDLLTYPGDEHNMMGRDRIHLHEHITRYFEDFLK